MHSKHSRPPDAFWLRRRGVEKSPETIECVVVGRRVGLRNRNLQIVDPVSRTGVQKKLWEVCSCYEPTSVVLPLEQVASEL